MTIDIQHARGFGPYRSLGFLVEKQLEVTPRYLPFFNKRFATADAAELGLCDALSRDILNLAQEDLVIFAQGYEFLCEHQRREEIYFRRHNAYRLTRAAEAQREVYSNGEYMQQYMRGLLLSQVYWSNHTAAFRFYLDKFLGCNIRGDLLEVGPGHGLLFSRAIANECLRSVAGWDLSAGSLSECSEGLRRLGIPADRYTLVVQDLLHAVDQIEQFDAVVLSEVLEHLEEPRRALQIVRRILRPHGRLYVNVPVNCPAPDHLFVLRSPEEAISFLESNGFVIDRSAFFPASNYSLEDARANALTISVCVVARKSAP